MGAPKGPTPFVNLPWKSSVGFAILIPALLVLPRGIFGRKRTRRSGVAPRSPFVTLAKAGVHPSGDAVADRWIPAFAGMTRGGTRLAFARKRGRRKG
jgi:hypothetical protein